jgi:hypothetical protein
MQDMRSEVMSALYKEMDNHDHFRSNRFGSREFHAELIGYALLHAERMGVLSKSFSVANLLLWSVVCVYHASSDIYMATGNNRKKVELYRQLNRAKRLVVLNRLRSYLFSADDTNKRLEKSLSSLGLSEKFVRQIVSGVWSPKDQMELCLGRELKYIRQKEIADILNKAMEWWLRVFRVAVNLFGKKRASNILKDLQLSDEIVNQALKGKITLGELLILHPSLMVGVEKK